MWIVVAIPTVVSVVVVRSNIKGRGRLRKYETYSNQELTVRSELVHSHRAYVSKLQKAYVDELGEYMVNQVIKQVVDAYPDIEFRRYLIQDIYPVIGYTVPAQE